MKIDEEIKKAWEELKKKSGGEKGREKKGEEVNKSGEKKEEEKEEEKRNEEGEKEEEGEKKEVVENIEFNENIPEFSIEISQDFNIESSEIGPPILISEGTKKEQERLEEKAFEGTIKRDVKEENEKQFYKNTTFYESEKYEIREISEITKELSMEPAKIEKIVIKDGMQEIAESMQKEAKLLEMPNRIIEATEIKPEEFGRQYEYDKYKSIKLESKMEKIKKYDFEE